VKDKNLTVTIADSVLIISIGVEVLQHAVEIGRACGSGDIKITNEAQFLDGFVRQLSSEKEDGSTLIHHAFDQAVTEMLENGELGVDEWDY
jgi:hypothetical protein